VLDRQSRQMGIRRKISARAQERQQDAQNLYEFSLATALFRHQAVTERLIQSLLNLAPRSRIALRIKS